MWRGASYLRGENLPDADNYLAMALDLLARAEKEPKPEKRLGLEILAEHYRVQGEQMRRAALMVGCGHSEEANKKAG